MIMDTQGMDLHKKMIDDEELRKRSRLIHFLQYEKKKYPREENVVDGYGNDMVLSDNQSLEWTDRALSLLFFSKTNKGFNFGLKRKVGYNMVAVKRLREKSPQSRRNLKQKLVK